MAIKRSLIAAAVAALTLVACGSPAPMVQPPQKGGSAQEVEIDELDAFYDQEVDWRSCGQDLECASVTVPVDYENADDDSIEIQMKKYELGSASGAVLINPGGPGGSGIETIDFASQIFTSTLRQNVALIGFDPRGVGTSAPISCYDDEELDELYATIFDLDTENGWEEYIDSTTEYGQACMENNPDLIAHVDTVSAARDMDIIRAAIGMDELDYLGFSYGTKLGATYAELFSANVGQFVLDGAVDPALNTEELTRGQVGGFEHAYRAYLEDCLTSAECPFRGSVDEAYDDTEGWLDQLAESPMNSGDPDRPVTDSDFMSAILLSMYATDTWPILSAATSAMMDGDAGQIKFLADFALERDEDGHYKPSDGAILAINCLDMPVELDQDKAEAQAEEFEELSPLFGPYLSYSDVGCGTFPIKTDNSPRAITAPDAPTMVVIGTTGDPATPYEWSEAMATQLTNSVLLTWDGEGHTAYGKGSCIDDAVDSFFIDGLLPEDGLRC